MSKFLKLTSTFMVLGLLAGCQSKTKYAVEPGYYQSGRYHAASEEPGYYDVFGHYNPGHVKAGYYQTGRWHRAYISTKPEHSVTGGFVTGGIVGEVGPETLGRIASDGDLSAVTDGEKGPY